MNMLMYACHPEYEKKGINAGPDGTPQGYRILSANSSTLGTLYKAFRDERGISFANPTLTKIWPSNILTRLSHLYRDGYLSEDGKNSYTVYMNFDGNGDPIFTNLLNTETLSGTFPLVLNAWSLYPIQKVEYKIDDGNWIEADQIYGIMWSSLIDTSKLSAGEHQITGRIVDVKGKYPKQMDITVE
jgi:hypothetical protein